jgi:hypothetical protein
VLTAVSRPENLPAIADSLAVAAQNAPAVQLQWHWRFDLERQHVGGQALKNAMLDDISDGWVWVLDDDTVAHPEVLEVFKAAVKAHPNASAVIFAQRRTDGRVLRAAPEMMHPGSVDIGQAFLNWRVFIFGYDPIPEHYNGDGMFLETVLAGATTVYIDEPLSLHNVLSGVDVSA